MSVKGTTSAVHLTREEKSDAEDAHAEGLHDEVPREGCPLCTERRPDDAA